MSEFGSNPLVFDYILTPQVIIRTAVTGDARNIATVTIINGTVPVWAASMTQASPKAVTPKLVMGDFTIEANSTFTLTVPTVIQGGNMFFDGVVASGPNPPVPFKAIVAQWPLSSSAAAAEFLAA